ncbi:hypothetical protein VNO80_08736 [Phaseolus coccineus]|uniref:Uncharacterized protein n=1 Tax=Phaseolus coccineus TaxID=3886 RepID=A0AAN9RD27_PHACN
MILQTFPLRSVLPCFFRFKRSANIGVCCQQLLTIHLRLQEQFFKLSQSNGKRQNVTAKPSFLCQDRFCPLRTQTRLLANQFMDEDEEEQEKALPTPSVWSMHSFYRQHKYVSNMKETLSFLLLRASMDSNNQINSKKKVQPRFEARLRVSVMIKECAFTAILLRKTCFHRTA